MAGRIRAEDVQEVKERTALDEVVREHVTLRTGGIGSFKGLCPFHDEKTPSFTVRPAVGVWHCFGCGEGGDAIEFVMKVDHLTFTEAVERLAGKLGMELRYDESSGAGGRGGRPDGEGGLGRRGRLVEAHRVAAELFHAALVDPDHPAYAEARPARDFLRAKGFDGEAARRFQVGFAPRSGQALGQHLRSRGFTEDELVTAGLLRRGGRWDVFQGRVLWPIRDITGDPVGFGARRLFEDDRMPGKYVNTSETPIYKKATVLYGLDMAKRPIADSRRAVVVEGYTDVMACHLSGVETAVATCGTAFGSDHIKSLRRILRDEAGGAPARVVFTFDGDAAGQKAAMRAFEMDQRWASQSYVAVAPEGADPNELWLTHQNADDPDAGAAALRDLVDQAVPMFEFAVRTSIAPFDLDRAEDRVQAMRRAAPIIGGIRDKALRPEYVRQVAGWLGVPVEELAAEVARAGRARPAHQGPPSTPAPGQEGTGEQESTLVPRPDLRDPLVRAERQLLQVVLQYPQSLEAESLDTLAASAFAAPAHQAIYHGVLQAGGVTQAALLSATGWASAVATHTPPAAQPLVFELAVAPLPVTLESSGSPPLRYVDSLVERVVDHALGQQIADTMSALQRAQDGTEARRISTMLVELQRQRALLRGTG